jgi:serine/threonine-protein kinase
MTEIPAPTLLNVVVLRLQDFTRHPVAEQARLKTQLEALVAVALQPLAADSRIVLDRPDGMAIATLGAPREMLELAERAQAGTLDLPLCIGINYGPVMPAPGSDAQAGLIGDGLATAATVAAAAAPGRLLASRAFQEVLARSAPDRGQELGPAGTLMDASVRTHQVYALDRQVVLTRRRRLITAGTLAVLSILGLGVLGRSVRLAFFARPGTILFEITPYGDIVIDGVIKGRSPPLTRLDVDPGSHVVEIRNSSYPPLTLEVTVESKEEMTIRHAFARPRREREEKGQRREGVIGRWRRKLGI